MDQMLAATFFPGLLVLFFTKVTFSRTISLLLTVALIVVSVYKGYTEGWILYILDAASLTVGYYLATKLRRTDTRNV